MRFYDKLVHAKNSVYMYQALAHLDNEGLGMRQSSTLRVRMVCDSYQEFEVCFMTRGTVSRSK